MTVTLIKKTYRNTFTNIQKRKLQEQYEFYKLKNPVRKYKPHYWDLNTRDLFQNLEVFEDRVQCLQV